MRFEKRRAARVGVFLGRDGEEAEFEAIEEIRCDRRAGERGVDDRRGAQVRKMDDREGVGGHVQTHPDRKMTRRFDDRPCVMHR